MSRDTKRVIYLLFALAVAIVLPLYAVKVYAKTDYTDFFVYYRAALRARQGLWDQIYTLADGASPFRYIPLILPVFWPFSALSLPHAQLVWYFCQFCFFTLGFNFLLRCARLISPERAGVATILSAVFILRFALDCFTIGQVSSLMFLGYCLGLFAYVRGDYFGSGAGVFIPTLFKVGPGFLFLLYPFSKLEEWIRAWIAPVVGLIVLGLATLWATGSSRVVALLFSRWREIVVRDDQYYDASHYGSQALKSFLLRAANSGWISPESARIGWISVSLFGTAFILWIWATRRARSAEGRGLLFSIGVFPYLWFMPETFKYSLVILALPILLLLVSPRRTRLGSFALVLGFLTLSFAGKDLLPDSLFFGLQKASIPFFATIVIAAAVFQNLFRATVTRTELPETLPRPWEQLPGEARTEGVSVLIPLPEKFPVRSCFQIVHELEKALERSFGRSWEIIWIAPPSLTEATSARVRQLVERFPQSKIITSSEKGQGSCLREGFLASSGKWIYLYRLEQPVGVAFFETAVEKLRSGIQLVRANRRDPDTRFLIPVRHLRVAYRRHRLGLLFNRLSRWALPGLLSTDTHSGHLLMSREVASQIFSLQTAGDFLFDLELCVISRAHRFREAELPVNLYLFEEKSGERILSEIVSIFVGLPRLRRRYKQGCYAPLRRTTGITADDWGLSPAVNQGILELARKRVIRRVSVMANTKYLQDGLEELRSIPGIQIGMHFTLTYGKPLSPRYATRSAKGLFFAWLNPLIGKRRLLPGIRQELDAQIELLRSVGVEIAYFDGHHHIHLVPGLIPALSDRLKENGIQVVRIPFDPGLKFTAKFPLLILSALAIRSTRALGFRTLDVFYPQRQHFRDHGLMRARINRNPSAEVIVHPASHNDIDQLEYPDPYTEGRVEEFRALQMLGFVTRDPEGQAPA